MQYPCSLQREFDCACTLTKSILQRIIGEGDTTIASKRIDDGGVEGEPCAVLYPAETKSIFAVVYPTAERLPQIRSLASKSERPLLLINPQWKDEGNVISDFGFFWQRNVALEFLAQFESTYYLKEKRIGSPGTINAATGMRFSSGGVVRVLRQWPSSYECYALAADGSSQFLQAAQEEPKYKDLESMIAIGRQKKLEIFDIAMRVTDVYASSAYSEEENSAVGEIWDHDGKFPVADEDKDSKTPKDLKGGIPVAKTMREADVDALDSASLRRILLANGQPTSGKISKLRERVKALLTQ